MLEGILLTTLNARYTHTSIGLRYLYANMHELQAQTSINEFTINDQIADVAEQILAQEPSIVGIGVYIWNALEVQTLIEILKSVAPQTLIVLGGPEVSYAPMRVDFSAADYIIQGEGDTAFYKLCRRLIEGDTTIPRILAPVMEDLSTIKLPYDAYTPDDIAHRYIYVEASRGCPFLCEFCLSSIDEKVRNFELEALIEAFEMLWQKGVRNYKFIDRTFNLNIRFANTILDFFLSKNEEYFAHFEVIPDHFPESIKEKIKQFPAGSLQLEIGIQTLNPTIANTISRPLKLEKIKQNLHFLETQTQAHMHVDLIVGLPGEDLESFGANLNALFALTKSEIQIGILKKLSGTALGRHDQTYGMVYSAKPPYEVLQTAHVSFADIQAMKRFARFWDMAYNSGNFKRTAPLLFAPDVYEGFSHFSMWIYTQTRATWKIALDRFAQLLYTYLTEIRQLEPLIVGTSMAQDYAVLGGRKYPLFLRPFTLERTTQGASAEKFQKRQQKREPNKEQEC